MKTWIISDTHFNHKNIIKYCNRPFNSVGEMNESMIRLWNNTVSKDDIVWHLGDFAMGTQEEIRTLVQRLNGRIYLITGNHDDHSVKWYYDCGFERVYDRPVIVENEYIFSHHPREQMAKEYKYVFGHVHDDKDIKDYTKNTFCACVERINYKPIDWNLVKKTFLKRGAI